MKFLFLIISLFISITCSAQVEIKKHKTFPGTNIRIFLPKSFKDNTSTNSLVGFMDEKDSTLIIATNANLNLSIKESSERQLEALTYHGNRIIEQKQFTHQNLDAFLVTYEIPFDNINGMILIFGNEDSQCLISAKFPKSRTEEIKKYLLSSKIDSAIKKTIPKKLLGFSAKKSSGPLKLSDANNLGLTYQYKDDEQILKAELKIVKSTKDRFIGMSVVECAEYVKNRYFSHGELIEEAPFLLRKKNGYQKIIKDIDPRTGEIYQYNSVTIFILDDFDLIIIGSAKDKNMFKSIDEIIKSIKID